MSFDEPKTNQELIYDSKQLTDEIRELRRLIALSHHQVHYLADQEPPRLVVPVFASGVAFLSRGKALGVQLDFQALLKIQLGDPFSMRRVVEKETISVDAQVYENPAGGDYFLIATVKVNQIPYEGEAFSLAPLFVQKTHDDKMEEWWLELNYSLIGPSPLSSPLRICWSVYKKEVK